MQHTPCSADHQRTKLIAFRQAIYQSGFIKRRDAQFELLDALLLTGPVRSFPELSTTPVFRRRWSSVYAALEDGQHNSAWLRSYLAQQVPTDGIQIFSLDGTAWLRPNARTLPDRQYVYSPAAQASQHPVGVGHPYSILAWVAEPQSSWALPLDVSRIASTETALSCGIVQVQQLCRDRKAAAASCLHIVVADAKYGTHLFLRPLRDVGCGVLVRLRKDRVLYRAPGPYSGSGRPRVHGERFAFKEPDSWGPPDQHFRGSDPQWGQVVVQVWHRLHARSAADTPISVARLQVHGEQERPPAPLWLGWQGPRVPAATLWQAYQLRWPVEPSIRTRKQQLAWTTPAFRQPDACDRWTMLVTLAQWQLYLARSLVADGRLPWQVAQERLSPGRVQRGLGFLFGQIGSPACAPKPRGSPPGWPPGRVRTRPARHPVVKKTTKPTKRKRKPPGRRRKAA